MFLTPATPQLSRGNGGTMATVKVAVRVRPLHQEETESDFESIITVNKLAKQVIVEDGKAFQFDAVYDTNTKQIDLYEASIAPLITKVKDGHNATVIAYGQTGSGKTFTMGTDPHAYKANKESEGIVQRSLESLLQQEGKSTGKLTQVSMSFLEVYNESVYDLFTPSKNKLAVKLNANGGVTPVNVMEEQVHSIAEGSSLLEKGSKHRAVSATALNQHSSRSHAIISLTVTDGEQCRSLRLVDLAGTECVGKAQMQGQQFSEGVSINKSLLGLGKVLAALGNPVSTFIPYRDSLLTRLLADSLGGNSHTCMVTCIHSTKANMHETINTLRFAEQARNVRTKPFISSTTKCSATKRRYDDVSSTRGAWKKRHLDIPITHNSTISTPGRKASDKMCVRANNTFATPCTRINEVLNSTALGDEEIQDEVTLEVMGKEPTCSLPPFPKGPLIFSDFSPPKPSPTSKLSPLAEKVSNCIEQRMMKRLEDLEDNIVDKILSKLQSERKAKKKRPRRSKHLINSSPKSSAEVFSDSLDSASPRETFNQTFHDGLSGKVDMKAVLQNLIQETMQSTHKYYQNQGYVDGYGKAGETLNSFGKENQQFGFGSGVKPLDGRKGLKDGSSMLNITHHGKGHMVHGKDNFSKVEDTLGGVPITSTALCDVRAVRRSSRLSMRRSLHHILLKENLTPVKDLRSMIWDDGGSPDISNLNGTVVHRESKPMLTPKVNLEPAFSGEEMAPSPNVTVLEKNKMQRYMKREDTELGVAAHLPEDNMMKSYLGSHQFKETTAPDTSLLQIDRIRSQAKKPRPVRRSSRHCAQIAMALNAEILKNESPISKRRSLHNKSKMGKTLNNTVNTVSSKNQMLEGSRWEIVISPRLQQNHRKTVLNVLNQGDLRQLQQLPTVGPKSAVVIHNYRQMCGSFEELEDLEKVPGLVKNFYKRFLRANLLSQIELI